MSRRTAIVEDFDDDTDLPLPSQPLSNTGARGPLIEEIVSSDDEDDDEELESPAGSASSPFTQQQQQPGQPSMPTVTDITPYKHWTCIYPIYIDAKRPYGTGERRISRAKSIWWPLSKDIADVTNRLGLGTLHEVNKAHPRDWENPGRVRVQWRKDGRLMNPAIKSKKQLLEMISFQIQRIKPDNIPKAPYQTASSKVVSTPAPPKSKAKAPISKSKQTPAAQKKPSSYQLPVPPDPQPPLASRVSAYSPALPSGVLIETVKAGMNAQEPGAAGPIPSPAGQQKGKRKVVRVRG